jgi:integrase
MARKLPRFLTLKEAKALFEVSSENRRDNMLLKCLFYLGLRNDEIRRLRRDSIDLINGNVKVVQGKGKKDRYVSIPSHLMPELKEWLKHCGPIVFSGRGEKGLLNDRTLRRIVKKHAYIAGLRSPEEIHVHTLRHSYATLLQNYGVPLNAIQEALGHERIETTRIYLHLGIKRRAEMIQKAFDDAFKELT